MTKHNEKVTKAQILDTNLNTIGEAASATSYIMLVTTALHEVWQHTARYAVTPVTALAAVIRLILCWREVYLAKERHNLLVKALRQTLSVAVLATTILGSIIAGSLFATVAPILGLAAIGVNVAYDTAMGVYCFIKSLRSMNPDRTYREKAKKHVAAATSGILAGLFIGAIVFVGNTSAAIAAAIVSCLFTIAGVYKGYKQWQALRQAPAPVTAAAITEPSTPVHDDSAKENSMKAIFAEIPELKLSIVPLENTVPTKSSASEYHPIMADTSRVQHTDTTHEPHSSLK